jgi:heterodisulfide reductase subunit C
MRILNLPYFPSQKAIYDMEKLAPTFETIMKLYPEIARCLACNTCTKICPMGLPVMEIVAAALRGEIQKAAELSQECVMCGLCASRCPAELLPYHIALLARRLYGKYLLPPYYHVINRLKQLENGEYNEEMEKLLKLSREELEEEYKKAQADKRLV